MHPDETEIVEHMFDMAHYWLPSMLFRGHPRSHPGSPITHNSVSPKGGYQGAPSSFLTWFPLMWSLECLICFDLMENYPFPPPPFFFYLGETLLTIFSPLPAWGSTSVPEPAHPLGLVPAACSLAGPIIRPASPWTLSLPIVDGYIAGLTPATAVTYA